MGNSHSQLPKNTDTISLNLRKRKKVRDSKTVPRLQQVFPTTKCYLRLLKLTRLYDFLVFEDNLIQSEPPVKEEMNIVETVRGHPLQIGTLEEFVNEHMAIVSAGLGPEYFVPVHSFVDRDLLEPGSTIIMNYRDYSVVGVLEGETDPLVSVMKLERAPTETYSDIGGLEEQIREIKESVELPLTNPELYDEMGIKPPRGVILYGQPGTGKTLLAKAVANRTSATFLRIVGSELIQKYLGDGPKLVREMFKVADMNAPSIIFIDEIDAIGKKRVDESSGAGREIQRTMLELLNQLDGFDKRNDIKVIMATNRIDSLDPALIRPGRIDRKIEFTLPDSATKLKIFEIHLAKMSLHASVNIKELITSKEDISGADIKAICSEAGMIALRERRREVQMNDFIKARDKVMLTKRVNMPEGLYV